MADARIAQQRVDVLVLGLIMYPRLPVTTFKDLRWPKFCPATV